MGSLVMCMPCGRQEILPIHRAPRLVLHSWPIDAVLEILTGLGYKASGMASKLSWRVGHDGTDARSYMSRIERGTSNLSLDGIECVAIKFHISVEELFKGL